MIELKNDLIWVISDENAGEEYTLQLLGQANILGKQCNKQIALIVFAEETEDYGEYVQTSADYIVKIRKHYLSDKKRALICRDIVKSSQPFLIIATISEMSRLIIAQVCTALKLGFVACCVKMKYDCKRKRIIFSRTAMDSSVEVNIVISSYTQVCTVQKNIFSIVPELEKKNAVIIEYRTYQKDSLMSDEILNVIKKQKKTMSYNSNLEESDIVFGVGKGAIDCIEQIKKIAVICNATVGCSRGLVEEGYFSKDMQIGQSGKSINAKIYISFGISGASQHLIGIRNVDKIIAITNDKHAPILKYCDYAFIANVKNVCNSVLDVICV